MKSFTVCAFAICALLLISCTNAAPPAGDADAQVLRYENDNIGVDGFNYAYETSDGQSQQANAHVNNLGSDDEELVVKGSYSFVGDDGQTYTINYIADKNGYQPQGAHIPQAL